MKNKLKFEHQHEPGCDRDWYEVLHEGKVVLTIYRQADLPYRWIAFNNDGKQCFEPNQYRHDLFEQIEYEGVFE